MFCSFRFGRKVRCHTWFVEKVKVKSPERILGGAPSRVGPGRRNPPNNRITSGWRATRNLATSLNTSAFTITDLVKLPRSRLLDRVENLVRRTTSEQPSLVKDLGRVREGWRNGHTSDWFRTKEFPFPKAGGRREQVCQAGEAAHRHTVTTSQAACRVPRASEFRSRCLVGVRVATDSVSAAALQATSVRSQTM